MPNISTGFAEDLIDWAHTSWAYPLHVALLTSIPSGSSIGGHELSSSGYSRASLSNGNWSTTTGSSIVYIEYTSAISFGTNTSGSSWDIEGLAIIDDNGNVLSIVNLDTTVSCANGDIVRIPANKLRFKINTSSANEPYIPEGGSDGQVLTKVGSSDYDVSWEDIPTQESGGGGSAEIFVGEITDYNALTGWEVTLADTTVRLCANHTIYAASVGDLVVISKMADDTWGIIQFKERTWTTSPSTPLPPITADPTYPIDNINFSPVTSTNYKVCQIKSPSGGGYTTTHGGYNYYVTGTGATSGVTPTSSNAANFDLPTAGTDLQWICIAQEAVVDGEIVTVWGEQRTSSSNDFTNYAYRIRAYRFDIPTGLWVFVDQLTVPASAYTQASGTSISSGINSRSYEILYTNAQETLPVMVSSIAYPDATNVQFTLWEFKNSVWVEREQYSMTWTEMGTNNTEAIGAVLRQYSGRKVSFGLYCRVGGYWGSLYGKRKRLYDFVSNTVTSTTLYSRANGHEWLTSNGAIMSPVSDKGYKLVGNHSTGTLYIVEYDPASQGSTIYHTITTSLYCYSSGYNSTPAPSDGQMIAYSQGTDAEYNYTQFLYCDLEGVLWFDVATHKSGGNAFYYTTSRFRVFPNKTMEKVFESYPFYGSTYVNTSSIYLNVGANVLTNLYSSYGHGGHPNSVFFWGKPNNNSSFHLFHYEY